MITADVRLDNRKELFKWLKIWPSDQLTCPDSLLLVKGFEKWGKKCVDYFLGDFAFAIWDKKALELFCARGTNCNRQFVYYRTPSQFIFATEIQAIVKLSCIPRELNEKEVFDALMGLHVGGTSLEGTFFKSLKKF